VIHLNQLTDLLDSLFVTIFIDHGGLAVRLRTVVCVTCEAHTIYINMGRKKGKDETNSIYIYIYICVYIEKEKGQKSICVTSRPAHALNRRLKFPSLQ